LPYLFLLICTLKADTQIEHITTTSLHHTPQTTHINWLSTTRPVSAKALSIVPHNKSLHSTRSRMLRSSILRASSSLVNTPSSTRILRQPILAVCKSQQSRNAHAISNPTLANIENRWEAMPAQEQADLWMALRDRMKADWHELTVQEKKAAYWIAFGPHGPRAEAPPGENWKVFRLTMYGVVASGVLFWITRQFAGPAPKTMNREWQEATNEYLRSENVEPISGVSSKGYTGPGMVQSPPSGKSLDALEDDE